MLLTILEHPIATFFLMWCLAACITQIIYAVLGDFDED